MPRRCGRRTTLHGPQVYLRDLFDDAGANARPRARPRSRAGRADRRRGARSSRRSRASSVSTGAQFRRADRAVLEWPGRLLRASRGAGAVRAALVAPGPQPDCDIVIPGFTSAACSGGRRIRARRSRSSYSTRPRTLHRHAVGRRRTAWSRSPHCSRRGRRCHRMCPSPSLGCWRALSSGRTISGMARVRVTSRATEVAARSRAW